MAGAKFTRENETIQFVAGKLWGLHTPQTDDTIGPSPVKVAPENMFEHLLSPEFDDLAEVDTPTLLSAQANTATVLTSTPGSDWFTQMGSPEHVLSDAGKQAARRAFATVLRTDLPDVDKNRTVLALKVPAAVKHLAGMLSQYDWDYVEQAKELRGYVVANLLEESKSPDSRIRLRALELIGKLSGVDSFMERSTVTHVQENNEDVENRLRARLKSLLPPVMEVQDVEVQGIAVVKKQPEEI